MEVLDEPGVQLAAGVNAVYRLRIAHMNTPLRRLAVFACLMGVVPPGPARSQDEAVPAGVLWEATSQVTMEGMPLGAPPNRMQVCVAAGATEPPGSRNEERGCVNSNFVREGLKVTWSSVCSGPPEMNGQGEITYADEQQASYAGAIRYMTEEGIVTIQLSGQRIGTCDKPR